MQKLLDYSSLMESLLKRKPDLVRDTYLRNIRTQISGFLTLNTLNGHLMK